MASIKVAHIREQGQDMILVPLDSNFGNRTEYDKSKTLDELQVKASAAGLRGRIVLLWPNGRGHAFMGPRPWHPFLSGLPIEAVMSRVNKQISW
jgi:hypothetical protein